MHVTPSELDECYRLADLILDRAKKDKSTIVLLGDQTHTHATLNVHVLAFWKSFFARSNKTIVLVGNHDQPGDGSIDVHSMLFFADEDDGRVLVVDEPIVIEPGVLALPYYHKHEDFYEAASTDFSNSHTLICHQTFDGSKYENGFPAHDGVDFNRIPQNYVISGHIHTPQTITTEDGSIWYVGAPRWRSLSDANIDRHIWSVEFTPNGPWQRFSLPTDSVCKRIYHWVDTPSQPVDTNFDCRHEYRIDIKGPPGWVEQREKELKRPGVKTRSYPEQNETPQVKESEGIEKAFQKYLQAYKPKNGTPIEVLARLARERLAMGSETDSCV